MTEQRPSHIEENFGEMLARTLNEVDRSQAWLATQVGVDRATVKRWISGASVPTPKNLAALFKALKIEDLQKRDAFTRAAGYILEISSTSNGPEASAGPIAPETADVSVVHVSRAPFGLWLSAALTQPWYLFTGFFIFLLVLLFVAFFFRGVWFDHQPDNYDFAELYQACQHNRQQKDFDLAIKYCNRAIELKPYEGFPYYDRGYAFYEEKPHDFTNALKDLDQAVRLIKPEYGWAYHLRGLIHMGLGHYSLAFEDFQRVLELEKQSRTSCQAGAGNFQYVWCDDWRELQKKECLNLAALLKTVSVAEANIEVKNLMKDCPSQ